jgi:hypothetical protein
VGLEPVEPIPGQAICAFGFVRYVDGDLGPYHEFLVSLLSKRPGASHSLGAYIHWLPVNQTLTCEAGQSIWGFPKAIADIDITPGRWHTDCELRLDGQLVVGVRVGAGVPVPSSALGAWSIDAYAYRDGVLRRTPWTMDISGVRARLGGGRIRWGDHPMSQELQALEIPTWSFMSSTVGKLRMRFDDAESIEGSAS